MMVQDPRSSMRKRVVQQSLKLASMAIQGTARAVDILRTGSSESTLQAKSRHSSGRVLLRHRLAGRAKSASNIGAFLHWYPILSSPLDASLELRPPARS